VIHEHELAENISDGLLKLKATEDDSQLSVKHLFDTFLKQSEVELFPLPRNCGLYEFERLTGLQIDEEDDPEVYLCCLEEESHANDVEERL
jgi:hypothetical protein